MFQASASGAVDTAVVFAVVSAAAGHAARVGCAPRRADWLNDRPLDLGPHRLCPAHRTEEMGRPCLGLTYMPSLWAVQRPAPPVPGHSSQLTPGDRKGPMWGGGCGGPRLRTAAWMSAAGAWHGGAAGRPTSSFASKTMSKRLDMARSPSATAAAAASTVCRAATSAASATACTCVPRPAATIS